MDVCFDHAMRELDMIQYHDPNKKLAKFVYRIPTKQKKIGLLRCIGAHANEKKCKKWGIFRVGFILKTTANKEYQQIMTDKIKH